LRLPAPSRGTVVGVFAAEAVLLSDTGFWGVVFIFVPLVLGAWAPHLVRVGRRLTATGDVRTTRQRRALLLGGAAAIVGAVAVGTLSLVHANSVQSERDQARSRALAAQVTGSRDAELAGLLSVEAYRASPTEEAEQAMVSALTRLQPSIQITPGQVLGVSVSPDGRIIAAAVESGVRLLSLLTRRTLGRLRVPGGITAVAFSPAGRRLATAGNDGRVRIWEVPALREVASTRVGSGSQLGVAYSSRRTLVASGGEDGAVTALTTAGDVNLIARARRPVPAVGFSSDGGLLAWGSLDGTVRVASVADGRLLRSLAGQRAGVLSVAFGRRRTLAASGSDGTIRVWAPDTGRPDTLRGHTGSIFSVAFDPSGTLLASGGDDATVRVWAPGRPPQDRAILDGFTGSVLSVAFSPDGRTVVAGGADGRVWLLNHVLWSGDPRAIEAAICARVGRTLSSSERTVLLSDSSSRATCD
jgi:WD40 repeat protein